ncbi:MAG: hypothetical protein IIY69_03975 [Clostridia bacterium]|nr:hypothetical protein [Clostridia bacterium]
MDKKKNLEEKQEFRNLKRYADAITAHDDDAEFEAILREYTSDRERYERTAPKSVRNQRNAAPADTGREPARQAPNPQPAPQNEERMNIPRSPRAAAAPRREQRRSAPERGADAFAYQKRPEDGDAFNNEIKELEISFENAPEAVKDFVEETPIEAQDRRAKLLDMAFGPADAEEFYEDDATDLAAFIEKKEKKDASDYYAELLEEAAREKAKKEAEERAKRAAEGIPEKKPESYPVIDIDLDAEPVPLRPASPAPQEAAPEAAEPPKEDIPIEALRESESELIKMGLMVGVGKKAEDEIKEEITKADENETAPEINDEAEEPETEPAQEAETTEAPAEQEAEEPSTAESEGARETEQTSESEPEADETAVFEAKPQKTAPDAGEDVPEGEAEETAEGEAEEAEGVTDKTIRIERTGEITRTGEMKREKSDWDDDDIPEDEWEEWGEPEENLADELKRKLGDKIGFIKKMRPGADDDGELPEGEEYETDEEMEQAEMLEEFEDPEEIRVEADEYDEVYDTLTEDSSNSWVRIIVSAIAFVLLALIDIFDFAGIVPPGAMGTNGDKIYAGVAIVILAVVVIMNIDVMRNGARTLFSNGRQQGVSFVFLSTVIICVQALYSFVRCLIEGEAFTSYASVVALAMLLYGIGRRVYDSTHIKNFEAIYEAGSNIMEVKSVADGELTKITSKFSTLGKNFYYKNNALTTGGFLDYARGGERETSLGSRMTSIILAVSVVCFILVAVVLGQRGGFERWFGLLAAVFAMVLPSMFEFVGSLVFARTTNNARRQGAVISGAVCASKYSEMEAVLLDDSDVFRQGTVLIKSLKLVDKDVISHILPDVASIFVTIDSPAKFAFMDIIDHREDMLKTVSFYERIDGEGLLALVDGAKILLGNRDFMISQGVISSSHPDRYFKEGKSRYNMYVALDGRLVCVFSMAYLLDTYAAEALMKLEREDVKSVIATFDPNLTEHGLKTLFEIEDDDSLKLMHPQDIMKFKDLLSTTDQIGRSGMYLTRQSVLSFTALIGALKSIRFATRMNKIFMMAAMIGAPILLTLIALFNGMTHIPPFIIILLQLLWNIPVWINSAFAK